MDLDVKVLDPDVKVQYLELLVQKLGKKITFFKIWEENVPFCKIGAKWGKIKYLLMF